MKLLAHVGKRCISGKSLVGTARMLVCSAVVGGMIASPALALDTGVQKLGLYPYQIDPGYDVRCYQSDAMEAKRPFPNNPHVPQLQALADEEEAKLAALKIAEDNLELAKKHARSTWDPSIQSSIHADDVTVWAGFLALYNANIGAYQLYLNYLENSLAKLQYQKSQLGITINKIADDPGSALGNYFVETYVPTDEFSTSNPAYGYAKKAHKASVELHKKRKQINAARKAGKLGTYFAKAGAKAAGGIVLSEVKEFSIGVATNSAFEAILDGVIDDTVRKINEVQAELVGLRRGKANLEDAIANRVVNSVGVSLWTPPPQGAIDAEILAQQRYDEAKAAADAAGKAWMNKLVESEKFEDRIPPCDSHEIATRLNDICVNHPEQVAAAPGDTFGENLVKAICTTVANSATVFKDYTKSIVANTINKRVSGLLNTQANVVGFIDGSSIGFNSPFGSFNLLGDTNFMNVAFSTSLNAMQKEAHRLQSRLDQQNSEVNEYGLIPTSKEGGFTFGKLNSDDDEATASSHSNQYLEPYQQQDYDVWVQVLGARSKLGTSESELFVGYVGAHYYYKPDFIIGAMAQVDWSEETDSTQGSSGSGVGWMIGPYMAAKIPDHPVYVDLRAAWGRSNSKISPLGTYTDDYQTERWMVNGQVTGKMNYNDVTIWPTVSLRYFEETQEAYTDSLNNPISAQTFSQGEMRAGPRFTYDIEGENGTVIRPSFGVSAVWNFAVQNNASTQGTSLGSDDLRSRVDFGVTAIAAQKWTLDLHGFYDGIGANDFYSYGGRAKVTVPFHK